MTTVERYARDVVAGTVPAGKYHPRRRCPLDAGFSVE